MDCEFLDLHNTYIHGFKHSICAPLEMYITLLPRKSLIQEREGETAIYVPRGVYTPQLQ